MLRFALAGNANVGKSVIFNALTGLDQHVGNWPGKTVELFSGKLHFENQEIEIVDLPGIYSFDTYSMEEEVTREYIISQKPDVVINVVDASALERNLYFTLQLLELTPNVVLVLNQMDIAERRGMQIDVRKLAEILGVPVVPAVAVRGAGIVETIKAAVEVTGKRQRMHGEFKFGHEVEKRIRKLTLLLQKYSIPYPPRFMAIRLLEKDLQMRKLAEKIDRNILTAADILANEIAEIHHEACEAVISAERYAVCAEIVRRVVRKRTVRRKNIEFLDYISTHRVYGYLLLGGIIAGIFTFVFYTGSLIAAGMENFFEWLGSGYFARFGESRTTRIIWDGLVAGGIGGALGVVLPFVLPFYVLLAILEQSGYLARAAFLMDSLMHRIGLHGKAFIPLVLGYGCNVPACVGCRIMETERERTLAAFLSTLVPCSARTVVILGVTGIFMGIHWAIALYAFNLVVVFGVGKIISRLLPGTGTGLIMEIPGLRVPQPLVVLKQTWFRVKEFLVIAMPIIMAGSIAIVVLDTYGVLGHVNAALSPLIVSWLGLPAVVGFTLIFGVLRKELTVVMLAVFLGTANFAAVLSPLQMLVFTVVVMFYVPCVATIAALVRELGWKKAIAITGFEIGFALLLGGIIFRVGLIAGV
ncbi:MAG: ferrous iron transport protein B [Thermoplasmata archaeon]|nr:ferrous iron transport protein B [Thermoplasmata archaeon]